MVTGRGEDERGQTCMNKECTSTVIATSKSQWWCTNKGSLPAPGRDATTPNKEQRQQSFLGSNNGAYSVFYYK